MSVSPPHSAELRDDADLNYSPQPQTTPTRKFASSKIAKAVMTFKGGGMLLLGAIIISIAHRPHSCRYYYSFYYLFFFDFLKTFCDHQSFFLDGPGRIPVLPHTDQVSRSKQP